MTKILLAVTVHGYMEEDDVKSFFDGTRLESEFTKDLKKFQSKSDETKKINLKSDTF